ncbi:E3 ubiquitin-protein ligase parkin, partial [Geodia barretti]
SFFASPPLPPPLPSSSPLPPTSFPTAPLQTTPPNHKEFFFKCSRHPTTADEQCVALHMVRKNTVGVDCASCFEQRDTVVVFDCPDKHTLCLDCFMEYCEVQLQDRQFEEHRSAGYTLRCPAKCEGSEIKESHHFRIMGPEKYDRYQRFGTEEFVLQMGGVLCPARGCGMGLLPEDPTARRVQCPRGERGMWVCVLSPL